MYDQTISSVQLAEGRDFDQSRASVTADDGYASAAGRLIAPQSGHPGAVTVQGITQGNGLADMAAAIGIALPRADRHNRAPAGAWIGAV